MPEFPVKTGYGGVALRAEPAAILKACENVGPLFVLLRNEACILGSIVEPLRFLEAGDVHLATSTALSLNLTRRPVGEAFGYLEAGPQGGFIDAIEFCGPKEEGFLKLCRMERTDRERWVALLGRFQVGGVDFSRLAGIRKTNHLNLPMLLPGLPSPAAALLDRFLTAVVETRSPLHITAPAPGARGRLALAPTHRVRCGSWEVLSSDDAALHLAPACLSELRVITRPHLAMLVLLGTSGRLIARILIRDRALIAKIPSIL